MSDKGPKTYQQALKKPSKKIWPGCGDGRKRWCGGIHNYSYVGYNGLVNRFSCAMNHRQGCPQPIPDPGVSYEEWKENKDKENKDKDEAQN